MKLNAAPLLVLLLLGCASGDALREEGFVASPAGSGTWWVSFEADSMTAQRARDNLLYNTARLVLDRGGTYFRFEEADPDTRLNRERSSSVSQDPSLSDPVNESYSSRVSLQRVVTVSAVAEIVSEPGDGVLDASRVLEELVRKYSS